MNICEDIRPAAAAASLQSCLTLCDQMQWHLETDGKTHLSEHGRNACTALLWDDIKELVLIFKSVPVVTL